MKNRAWLRCDVRPGMFDDEVAICVTTLAGGILSFFIPADLVGRFSAASEEKAISVDVVDRNGEYGIVALPGRSFEGSSFATVPAGALRFA